MEHVREKNVPLNKVSSSSFSETILGAQSRILNMQRVIVFLARRVSHFLVIARDFAPFFVRLSPIAPEISFRSKNVSLKSYFKKKKTLVC